jgi:hypothetical protein
VGWLDLEHASIVVLRDHERWITSSAVVPGLLVAVECPLAFNFVALPCPRDDRRFLLPVPR